MTPLRLSERKFGFTMAGAFVVLSAMIWLLFRSFFPSLLVVAAIFALFALAAPGLLLPVNRIWGRFGRALGWVNNNVLLSVFFILIVVPTGLCFRLMKRDALDRDKDDSARSYLSPVRTTTDTESLRNLF